MLKISTFIGLLFIGMLSAIKLTQPLKGQVPSQQAISSVTINSPIKKNRISKEVESVKLMNLVLGRYFE